jgi:hypothetical protein
MCLGQPSRVPGGSIFAVREMEAMFPIIRRPYGCLLYGGISGVRSWERGSSGRRAGLGRRMAGGASQADGAGEG